MDLSASVSITQKGLSEVKNRAFKLSMKRRSVLLFLEKPHTVEYILSRSVFPAEGLIVEILALAQDGFIALSKEAAPMRVAGHSMPHIAASNIKFGSLDEMVVPEAKFMMIDFTVDSFGTEAEEFTEEIHACENVSDLSACLRSIVAAAEKQCPDRLLALSDIVREINEMA